MGEWEEKRESRKGNLGANINGVEWNGVKQEEKWY